MSELDPARQMIVPAGYRCPLCPCCGAGDSEFRYSQVADAAICEGCDVELSHFLECDEREQDPVLDALEASTGVTFREARRRYYREAIAIFRWKLLPENVDRETTEEAARTKRTAAETVEHWSTTVRAYEATLQALEAS